MEHAAGVDRLQFAFTITFHYIFPQLTMGLALLIVYLKTMALRPATNTTTAPRDSGRAFSASTSRWAW